VGIVLLTVQVTGLQRHATFHRTPEEWLVCRRDLYLTTHDIFKRQTNIHALRGIRTHNSRKLAAAHPLLRPRGHWDRLNLDNLERNNAGSLPTSTAGIKQMTDMQVKRFECANSVFGFSEFIFVSAVAAALSRM